MVGLVADLEAEQCGASVRLDREREAEVGRAGALQINLVESRFRQAPVGEETAAVDPHAEIGEHAVLRRPQPAGQPGDAGREPPLGGVNLDGELPLGGL